MDNRLATLYDLVSVYNSHKLFEHFFCDFGINDVIDMYSEKISKGNITHSLLLQFSQLIHFTGHVIDDDLLALSIEDFSNVMEFDLFMNSLLASREFIENFDIFKHFPNDVIDNPESIAIHFLKQIQESEDESIKREYGPLVRKYSTVSIKLK